MDWAMAERRSRNPDRAAAKKNINLKWLLTFRVATVALACFGVTTSIALIRGVSEIRRANETLADIVAKGLEVQLFRIDSQIGIASQFPDWESISQAAQSPGQCITYAEPRGTIERSSCVGVRRIEGGPAPWLVEIAGKIIGNTADQSRAIQHRGKFIGTIYVTSAPAALISTLWDEGASLLSLTAMMVVAICLMQYIAISHALHPTQEILEGLDRLRKGELAWRLPNFQLVELQKISEVFNGMAEGLLHSTHERKELAAKLVDGQEQERSRLARELHDELAQSLSAISAIAASISATASVDCPALVPETKRLRETSQNLMKSLRATLNALRPPEIDDFGLETALLRLKNDHERVSGGKLEISLNINDAVSELPVTAAAHIYRIVQEGLTNINKHAEASRASVSIGLTTRADKNVRGGYRWLLLKIEDNGSGIGASPVLERGLGLIGMRERVTALGGELAFFEPTGYGFGLEAYIPVESTSVLGS
jgi:signal transduction histidine kinase